MDTEYTIVLIQKRIRDSVRQQPSLESKIMQTLLYHSHHAPPFWHRPSQPYTEYNPSLSANWRYEAWDKEKQEDVLRSYKDDGGWALPILNGLHNLNLPLLAHISFSVFDNTVRPIGKCWVQISTISESVDEAGLPLVVVPSETEGKGTINVTGLWGFDNGTRSPWEFAWAKEVSEAERMTSEFWRSAFLKQLSLAKVGAIEAAEKAASKAATAAAYVEHFKSIPFET